MCNVQCAVFGPVQEVLIEPIVVFNPLVLRISYNNILLQMVLDLDLSSSQCSGLPSYILNDLVD